MRYFLVLFLSCSCCVSLYAVTAYWNMGQLDDRNAYLCQFIDQKIKMAKTLKSPKIVIVAGSNAYAGLSAKIIEETFNLPTFNFGLHAALTPQFIFYNARQVLTSNDIVVLPLEYNMYYENQPSDLFSEVLFGCGQSFFEELRWREKIQLLLTRPVTKIVENLCCNQMTNHKIELNFNAWGDATYNQEQQVTPAMRQRVIQDLIGIQFDENSAGVKAITDFIRWCRQNNITVFATWPNIVFKPIYRDQLYVRQNIQKIKDFYQAQQIPVIGTADESMFDVSYFYDTPYHLHQRGVTMRTLKLLELYFTR